MLIRIIAEDIHACPFCPVQPALKRLTGHEWLVSVNCAERQVEVEEDGETMIKTAIIEMPQVAYDYIAQAAEGRSVQPLEFEVEEPRLLS